MIGIQDYDFSCVEIKKEIRESASARNSIFIDDCSMWIKTETMGDDGIEYRASISFSITKDFIKEIQALLSIVEI